ncbi:fibronectin type III domain-containing protein [Pedobacter frigiditerrae]|uniref:fibronectin type III domain-containing protein n=1 Tax=Pedobacter frigiditerrae TaxID=2530452 RepID=UPI00292D4C66|nr:fibronectin type III domain-containing protein [Pedobacter frigiditerrae]
MKKNNIYISIFFLMTLIGFSGCKDDMMEEITTLNVDRTFSPTGLTASVVNKTNVLLTWKAVNNAKTYTVEVFENADFSGTAVKTIPNITFTQVPYTVTGLSGDTQYSIRVKGVGEGTDDSKWVTASAKTDPEQIFSAINAAKLTANSVALNWPTGQTATTITLSPGNITRTVTAAEIAAGEAIVTGLTGETLYTAKLLNGTKVRGTITFTTLLDLGGAIAVYPTDNLATLIANANAGDVFALFPGTYNINADITATKSISIKGAKPTDKPMIKGMIIRLKANAGLALKDLDIDGTGSLNGNQAVIYDEASDNAYGNLSIENCIIKNYVKGLIYVNVKALIESVTIKGNLISNIECNGGDFIDFRTGLAKTVNFSNNTVYNSALARDFFRMDPTGSTNFPTITSVITISTNTLNGMCNGAANRLLYVRLANHQIFFSKNIVANSGGILTNQASTIIVAANFTGNNYFNAPTYLAGSATANAKYDTGTSTSLNPGFTAPATGNFTISETTLKTNGIGDPRWR